MLTNKIMGAVLAILLVILGLKTVSDVAFGKGHHGHHAEETELSVNEKLKKKFAYYIEIAETAGPGAVEEVYDLGLLLASADVDKGASSFRSKCSSCHTVEQGGANGTGPNLYGVMGATVAAHSGFGYSGAMTSHGGEWSWERLDAYLENPRNTVSGTAMAFAGLRKDPERMNVLAYLASYSPDAPAMPEPLPAIAEEVDTAAVEGEASEGGLLEAVVDTVEEAADTVVETGGDVVDVVEDIVTGDE